PPAAPARLLSPRFMTRSFLSPRTSHPLLLTKCPRGSGSWPGSTFNVNSFGPEGQTALHQSVIDGNLELVKLLVKFGADIRLANRDGWSALPNTPPAPGDAGAAPDALAR
uniref:Uncharacterized protein n=1 Tax=Serinus canaria TaxID=9135 RepID=A0A8C9UEA2_SERCA